MQRAIDMLYHLDLSIAVDDYVRPMPENGPDAVRREVVLVVENGALKIVDPASNAAGLRLYTLVETP